MAGVEPVGWLGQQRLTCDAALLCWLGHADTFCLCIPRLPVLCSRHETVENFYISKLSVDRFETINACFLNRNCCRYAIC